jgi:lipopolysaccharide/colanic/teichoic acid biosynthesis glycosyltransferase
LSGCHQSSLLPEGEGGPACAPKRYSAQEQRPNELPIPVKVDLDAYYLNNRSFLLDMRIIIRTFVKVVKSEGVSH